jgi:hypothetical protein
MPAYDHIASLEKRLGLTPGFLSSLQEEDDWSFVIKCHAFVEAALSEYLSVAVNARLGDIFASMQMGGRNGKLQFARALELLTPESARFVTALSQIRNTFAHDVRSTGLSLGDYLGKFELPKLKTVAADILSPFDGVRITGDKGYQFFVASAKDVIYYGLLIVLAEIHFAVHPAENSDGQAEAAYQIAFMNAITAIAVAMIPGVKALEAAAQSSGASEASN